MKDFNDTAKIVGQKIVAIEAVAKTASSKAYLVTTPAADVFPIRVHSASYHGEAATSIRVAADDAELEGFVATAGKSIEVVDLPKTPESREKLIAQWAKKAAKKNKNGMLPMLLLPLAACGGSETSNPFEVVESPAVGSGDWLIDSDNGAVSLAVVDDSYVLTPTTGSPATVAKADIDGTDGLIVNAITLTADAADISGETVSGTGTVVVTNI